MAGTCPSARSYYRDGTLGSNPGAVTAITLRGAFLESQFTPR
jgi:hypothetical protein